MSLWRSVTGAEATRLDTSSREVAPGHALRGRTWRALARRDDRDDVAYDVTPGGLCVAHLTYAAETDPRWPAFAFVETLPEDGG